MDISDLAGLHREVEEITADLDVWAGRQEPDARARRYGSAAVSAIDAAIAELQQIRARLTAELRSADSETDARAAALLVEAPESAPVPPPAVMGAFREAARHGWSAPPALQGYGYVLPEDYLRGGAQ